MYRAISPFLLWLNLGTIVIVDSTTARNCSCYSFVSWESKSWNASQEYCLINKTGSLVSIETQQEWEFVNSKIQERNFSDNQWWIGLRKYEERWLWSSGKLLSIDKWQTTGENPGGDGDCVAMTKISLAGAQGLYEHMNCTFRRHFVCQYDSSKVGCKSYDYTYCGEVNDTDTNKIQTTTSKPLNTPPSSITTRIGLLIFVVIFGFVLSFCTVTFIYVFCVCAYMPGYEGDGINDRKKLYKLSKPKNPLVTSVFYLESLKLPTDATTSFEIIDQTLCVAPEESSNKPQKQPFEHHQHFYSEESKRIEPVVYAQVHKLSSNTRTLEEDGAIGHESESDKTDVAESESKQKFSTDSDTVVYSNIRDLKINSPNKTSYDTSAPFNRHRSNTMHIKSIFEDDGFMKETPETSSRRQTWGAKKPRDHGLIGKRTATWYDYNVEVEDNDSHVEQNDRSEKINVIYATIDKSKKSKRQGSDANAYIH